ncbi:MAG: diguanylate cyclase [Tolumonas sp.]|nr:diguanylate cyclase [Tolumonas sp.]
MKNKKMGEEPLSLQESEARLKRVLEGSEQGFWDWELPSRQFIVSDRFETMLGYEPGEGDFSIDNWATHVHPDDLAKAIESINLHLAGKIPCHQVELRIRTKSGEWKYVLTHGKVVSWAEDGTPLMMSGTHTDITERKKAEKQVFEQAELLDLAHDAIIVLDINHIVTFWNRGAERTYGWSQEEVRDQDLHQLLETQFPQPLAEIEEILFRTGQWEGELEHVTKNGSRIVVASRWAVKRDENNRPIAIMEISRDMTERKALLTKLELQARQDYLTGLNNRGYFMELAEREIKKASRYGHNFSILMIDIDNFKIINDTYGHKSGDQVLITLADIFQKTLRVADIEGRIGGEEFAVFLPETDQESAAVVAERLRSSVENAEIPLHNGEVVMRFTISIGISTPTSADYNLYVLLSQADEALYCAKHAGRNKVCIVESSNMVDSMI